MSESGPLPILENEAGLTTRRLLFHAFGVSNDFPSLDAFGVEDGALIVTTQGARGSPLVRQEDVAARLDVSGRIELVARRERSGGGVFAQSRGVLMYATDDLSFVLFGSDETRSFHIESGDLAGPFPQVWTVPEPLADQRCRAIGRMTPTVSAERLLVIRGPCDGEAVLTAERWASSSDGTLARVSGPYTVPEPHDAILSGARATAGDGVGGMYWVGRGPEAPGAERTDRSLVVMHWDGDSEPVSRGTLGPIGTTTDFAIGFMHPSGDFIALGNHLVDTFSRTYMARVRADGSFAWVWESPRGFFSGPSWPAAAVTGDGDLVVPLIEPGERDALFFMRLSADGVPAFAEPRRIHGDLYPAGITLEGGGMAAAGHPDGSFHVLWAESGGLRLASFDPEGTELWFTLVGGTRAFEVQLFADRGGGVWVAGNSPRGEGGVQHYGADGWPLYRTWTFDCGFWDAIIARPAPDAAPIIYAASNDIGR